MRFLNLIEEDLPRISHTGIAMWGTTINNLSQLSLRHDALSIGGGILANATALVAHTVKRSQNLKAKE